MRIFLVYTVLNSQQDVGYNYGLGYIAAVLKSAGHDVDYFVIKTSKDVQALYRNIEAAKPGIVGFSSTTTQFDYLSNISKSIKQISNSYVLCGGVHPTLKPECIYEIPEMDAIVRGEGEFPLLELANAIENKTDHLRIKNIWFREKDNIVRNDVRNLIGDLDTLPFPDKESLDYQKVIDEYDGINHFIFSRGCPFQCTYCSNKALSKVFPDPNNYFRQRSPQKAIEEIERDAGTYKFEYLVFDDDTISLNKKWFYEFFNLYRETFNYPFRCNLRVGTVDSDMMKLLKEAGASGIGIGIEHGNEKFRKTVLKRNMSNRQIIETFELCDKYGIEHTDFIMIGFPFETEELILDTIKLCREVSAKGTASIFNPYPGTELSDICMRENWLPDRKFYRERADAVISYPDLTNNTIQLYRDAFPYLIRYKFIPLNIFLKPVLYVFRFLKYIKKATLWILRRHRTSLQH